MHFPDVEIRELARGAGGRAAPAADAPLVGGHGGNELVKLLHIGVHKVDRPGFFQGKAKIFHIVVCRFRLLFLG